MPTTADDHYACDPADCPEALRQALNTAGRAHAGLGLPCLVCDRPCTIDEETTDTQQPTHDDLDQGGIRHLRLAGQPCPSGRPYPHTADAQCHPADNRPLSVHIQPQQIHFADEPGHPAEFQLPTVARLRTDNAELRQQLADEQATHAKTLSNFGEFVEGSREREAELRRQLAAAAQTIEAATIAAASVPHVARTEDGPSLPLVNEHAARQLISPGHPTDAAQWPVEGAWGPYKHERETRLEPMPVAVRELHDGGLVRSGDPDRIARSTVLAHLVAAVEAARLELGTYDERVLGWLAGGEVSAAQVVIGLIRRAHEAGRGAGRAGSVLGEVANERRRQDATWGEQNHPDGTGQWVHEQTAAMLAREACRKAAEDGTLTWAHVLREEVYEALAEAAPARVRAELVQVAAVAVAWVEAIDRREASR